MTTEQIQTERYCPKCNSTDIIMFDSDNDICLKCNYYSNSFPSRPIPINNTDINQELTNFINWFKTYYKIELSTEQLLDLYSKREML